MRLKTQVEIWIWIGTYVQKLFVTVDDFVSLVPRLELRGFANAGREIILSWFSYYPLTATYYCPIDRRTKGSKRILVEIER